MRIDQSRFSEENTELSLVIPVYNGACTIGALVQNIRKVCAGLRYQIVLVNDGSEDESEWVCSGLADQSRRITFVNLSRNFGEHNAVLAGLNHARGEYVAVLDDDGQNPPEEALRMLEELRARKFDVVYGRYLEKKHSWFRNLGSRFNNWMATIMLEKPPDLYLSSFKVMNRFLVDEITKYRGAFPYIDGLIYRSTRNIGQITVTHRESPRASRYSLPRLIRLWFNMFLNFSILPLRFSVYLGVAASIFSVLALGLIWIDKIYFTKDLTPGIRTVLGIISLFSGVQLMLLGLVGEYLGRLYLDHTGAPQFIVRYTQRVGNGKTSKCGEMSGNREIRKEKPQILNPNARA